MFGLPTYLVIVSAILPVLFAITVHEVSHGWVASRLGDQTARLLGRLTLNPIKHIDPVGTILIPLFLLYATGGRFAFGWAKPVPVNWRNLFKPRRDMAIVAAAGPMSNFAMAIGWAIILSFVASLGDNQAITTRFMISMCYYGVLINIVLMVLNLIPIPPLDGSRVVTSILPPKQAYYYSMIEPYGFFILIALLLTGVLNVIIEPIASVLLQFIFNAFIN